MSVRIDSAEGRWPMLYTQRVRRAVDAILLARRMSPEFREVFDRRMIRFIGQMKAFMARQAWRVDYEEVE